MSIFVFTLSPYHLDHFLIPVLVTTAIDLSDWTLNAHFISIILTCRVIKWDSKLIGISGWCHAVSILLLQVAQSMTLTRITLQHISTMLGCMKKLQHRVPICLKVARELETMQRCMTNVFKLCNSHLLWCILNKKQPLCLLSCCVTPTLLVQFAFYFVLNFFRRKWVKTKDSRNIFFFFFEKLCWNYYAKAGGNWFWSQMCDGMMHFLFELQKRDQLIEYKF